jgi:adenylate kinase
MINSNIILLGMPGTGKGTQAKFLKEKHAIPHISTGELFREAASKKTKVGLKVKGFMEEGKLIPNGIVNEVILERLARDDCKKGFILDGYPRTIQQAKFLDKILAKNGRPTVVLFITLEKQEVVKRLTGRRICENCGKDYNLYYLLPRKQGICDVCGEMLIQREDDKIETINKRIEVYWSQTNTLVEYYKKRKYFFQINGKGTVNEINKQLVKLLQGQASM